MPLVQAINDPLLYIQGLLLSYVSATGTVSCAPGQCRDLTNTNDISITSALSLDLAISGVGGLDTGTVANNTLYYAYLIASSTKQKQPALIASAASASISAAVQQPAYPFGYDTCLRLGAVRTDGFADIRPFTQRQALNGRKMTYKTPISLVAAGNATVATAVTLATLVPLNVSTVKLKAVLTPNAAANTVTFSTNTTSGEEDFTVSGPVSAVAQTGWGDVDTGATLATAFYYKVSSASDAVTFYLSSYVDTLIVAQAA